ncbi:MAG: hypothetical protein K9M55_00030 [Candidatus Marinimicrobia bacterium]|nr:hypothetical protein [Candidatus Neomarinimicrobiota bacterium]MCF7921063.1 hypothetical protein [Candidatus Neomarinimicrobiota bacterium]
MNSRGLLTIIILFPVLVLAQIPDVKIPSTVEKYFQMCRTGPDLVSVEVVNHHQSGRTLKIKIIARRNQSGKDLAFAFAAAAAVANMADRPFELLWVEMDVNFKGSETTLALAPANCTIDALIFGNCETEKWWQDCLQFP